MTFPVSFTERVLFARPRLSIGVATFYRDRSDLINVASAKHLNITDEIAFPALRYTTTLTLHTDPWKPRTATLLVLFISACDYYWMLTPPRNAGS